MKVYCHEGEGEGNEHLDSMDLLDVKSELERDAEKSEVRERVGYIITLQYLILRTLYGNYPLSDVQFYSFAVFVCALGANQ